MKKVAYLLDSTLLSDIKAIEGTNIFVQPLHVMIGEDTYSDLVALSPDEFYQAYQSGKECSTSQPSPGEFAQSYEKIRDAGYEDIIVLTLSSGLSGTYNSARQAIDLVEKVNIHLADTKLASSVVYHILQEVIVEADEHPEWEIVDCMRRIESICATAKIYIYIGDLEALRKGGRLGNVGAALGKLLQIKPIVSLNPDGTLDIYKKERTEKKSMQKVVDALSNQPFNRLMLLRTSNDELVDSLEQLVTSAYPNQSYTIEKLSPVIGTHIGTEGTAVFAWEV